MGGYIPNSGGASGNGIVTDEFSNVYITGGFSATMDFDPSINVNNLTTVLPNIGDMFVLKLGPCTPSSFAQSFTFCPGPGISVGNNTYYTSGLYIDTLFNATGCDSIVTTNLTVYPIYDSLQTIYLCSYDSLLIGGIYQDTTGVYIDTIIDANGCINTITTTLWVFAPINTSVTINNNNLVANYPPLGGVTYQWLDCNINFSPISGETNQIFTPIANGSYAVIVNNTNCVDTSICTSFMTVGLTPLENNFYINIYPNPTNEDLILEVNNLLENKSYKLLDNIGRQLLFGSIDKKKTTLQLKDITKGIYYLQILDNLGHQKTIKVLRE
jgi:hypothetical protein